ncbi:hypothetical protein BJX68DRAFT_5136 [Aspergillus pseudodeflectus]|uniref:Uncharacterized protein n=1 Tax=Aspergillus pseudodeflectus TaxID=176178 RepID=A0ABR4LA86_9EURO
MLVSSQQCSDGKHPLAEIQRRSIEGWIPIPTKAAFARCKDKARKALNFPINQSRGSDIDYGHLPAQRIARLLVGRTTFCAPSLLFFSAAQILLLIASSSSFFALLAVQFVSNSHFYFLPLLVVLQAPFSPLCSDFILRGCCWDYERLNFPSIHRPASLHSPPPSLLHLSSDQLLLAPFSGSCIPSYPLPQ